MYAKLLQICILAISISISVGTSDKDEPNGIAKNYINGNEDAKDNVTIDYGEASSNNDKADLLGAKPNVTKSDGNESAEDDHDANDDPGAGEDIPDKYDDAGKEIGKGNGNDSASYEKEDTGTYYDAGKEYGDESKLDYESESNDEYGGKSVPINMPGFNEMLDRNKPELGFDLSYDEMMKLKMWPDAFIPYYIDVYSFNDKVIRDKIRSFLSSVNSLTALNFVELPSPPSNYIRWVFFVNRRGMLGCADHSIRNFTNTGVQQVVLGYHCMSTEGELAEAVLAIAGVPAQHNAPDRDYYIKIKEENIIPEKKYLFEKRKDDEWLFHDLEYDFNSAGHFHRFKHSMNGRPTIDTQKNEAVTIGESKELTANDILKIRMLYNFIVKKKLLQAPDCYKLFEPGKKFRQYIPSGKPKSRPKPFRYTGESPDAPLDQDDVEVDSYESLDENNNNNDYNVKNLNDTNPDGINYINNAPNENQIPNNDLDKGESTEEEEYDDADYVNVNDQPSSYDNNNSEDPENGRGYTNEVSEEENLTPSDFHARYPNGYPEEQPDDQNEEDEESDNLTPSDFHKRYPNGYPEEPTDSNPQEDEESDNISPPEFHGKTPKIIWVGKWGQTKANIPVQNQPLPLSAKLPNSRNKKTHDPLSALSDFNTDEEGQATKKNWQRNPKAASNAQPQKLNLKFKPHG